MKDHSDHIEKALIIDKLYEYDPVQLQ